MVHQLLQRRANQIGHAIERVGNGVVRGGLGDFHDVPLNLERVPIFQRGNKRVRFVHRYGHGRVENRQGGVARASILLRKG